MSGLVPAVQTQAASAVNEETGEFLPLLRRQIPAWAVSLGLHLLILTALAFVSRMSAAFHDDPPPQSTATVVDPPQTKLEDFTLDTTHVLKLGNSDSTSDLGPNLAAAVSADVGVGDPVAVDTSAQFVPGIAATGPARPPAPRFDALDLNRGMILEPLTTVGTSEVAGGVEGAIDRLTHEIASSLRERKTLVVWLLDASLSLKDRRDAIADRFENVYRQLGQLKLGKDGTLKTAVVSFGAAPQLVTPEPVEDYREVAHAVRNVAPDESGVENVFSAVAAVTDKWKGFTRRDFNVMIIIVTDERGDDIDRLEAVIAGVRRHGIRVYCVGNAAVFGRQTELVTWRYEDGEKVLVPVDRGPESVAPERLALAPWGGGELEQISATFGPYALTRLCTESGGLYLITDEVQQTFDPEIMRNYRPDYVSVRDYEAQLAKNAAKAALVRAASGTAVSQIPSPQLQFRADTLANLRAQLTEAQKPLALLDYQLREIHAVLEQGVKDRPKLKEPRWRAGFDLALGRVLAMRVRAFGYNLMLANMKVSPPPFQQAGSNMWQLVPAAKAPDDPDVKKMAEGAVACLQRVVHEHPGTPWARLAQAELNFPLGWRWQEGRMFIPEPPTPEQVRRQLLLAEEQRRKNPPKPPPAPRTAPKL